MNETQSPPQHPESAIPQEEADQTRLIERPDGFYWQDRLTDKLYGPFVTRFDALEDMQFVEDSAYEEGETLEEAESEIGIADWIDPDTGAPAEGPLPHLNDK